MKFILEIGDMYLLVWFLCDELLMNTCITCKHDLHILMSNNFHTLQYVSQDTKCMLQIRNLMIWWRKKKQIKQTTSGIPFILTLTVIAIMCTVCSYLKRSSETCLNCPTHSYSKLASHSQVVKLFRSDCIW
jgi:hypothetical protein